MNALKKIKAIVSDENTFVFLISLILITLPLKHIINSVSVILFCVITIVYQVIYKNRIRLHKVNILFISVYGLVIISLLWTINFNDSIKGIRSMASFLAIPMGFYFMPKLEDQKVNKILRYFSFSMVFYAIYCLVIGLFKFFETKDTTHLFYHELSSALDQINAIYLSVYIAFALFFLILKIKNKKIIHYFSILVLAVFLFLLSSKTILTISFLVFIIYLMTRKEKKVFLSILIICFVLLFYLIPRDSNSVNQRIHEEVNKTKVHEILAKKEFGQNYYWTGFGLRLLQSRSYFEMIKEDRTLLLGYGFNASQGRLIEKYRSYNLYPGFYEYNFHNQYIQFLAEIGILGFIVLILIFYSGIKNAIDYKNLLFFVFNFLIVFLCITESYLSRQRGMVFFITVFLLLYKTPYNFEKIKQKT